MKDIYLFRHGQTEWNLLHKMQGHRDIPLNETGLNEARELHQKVSNVTKTLSSFAVYSSDLKRAHETCKIVLPHKDIVLNDQLREIDIGMMEGMSRSEINFDFQSPTPEFRFEGGESIKEHRERIMNFVKKTVKQDSHEVIILSTHGGTMARFLEQCENYQFKKINNCELVHVKYKNSKFHFINYL